MFGESVLALAAGSMYTALLLAGAASDIRSRRIPNLLVLTLALAGLVFSVFAHAPLAGFARAISGLLVGLACWLPFYLAGWLGAGDVKFFAAAGTWLGPRFTLEASLIAAIAGGVLALLWMIRAHGTRRVLQALSIATVAPAVLPAMGGERIRRSLPYGVALAFAALLVGWKPGLLFGT